MRYWNVHMHIKSHVCTSYTLSLSLHRSLQPFNSYHIIYTVNIQITLLYVLHVDFDIIFEGHLISQVDTHTHMLLHSRKPLCFMSQQASCIDLDSDAEGGIIATRSYVVMGVGWCWMSFIVPVPTRRISHVFELEQASLSGGEISSVEEVDDGKLEWYGIMNRTVLHTFVTRMNLVEWLQITISWFVARHYWYLFWCSWHKATGFQEVWHDSITGVSNCFKLKILNKTQAAESSYGR